MTKLKKIDAKWKEESDEVNKKLRTYYVKISKEFKKMLDWMLFYQPKNNFDKYWHLLDIILVDIVLLKVFGLI